MADSKDDGGKYDEDDGKKADVSEIEVPDSKNEFGKEADCKVILLGDSAVGKSKLVERFLMDAYNPRQLSTFALTLYRQTVNLEEVNYNNVFDDKKIKERKNDK